MARRSRNVGIGYSPKLEFVPLYIPFTGVADPGGFDPDPNPEKNIFGSVTLKETWIRFQISKNAPDPDLTEYFLLFLMFYLPLSRNKRIRIQGSETGSRSYIREEEVPRRRFQFSKNVPDPT